VTAIISAGNMMTVGVINELKAHRRHVPSDVAVVGFGDPKVAENYTPKITSVSLMSSQVALLTINLYKLILDGRVTEPVRTYITPKIIVRDSCGGRVG
jgi:DNA-binding LacI/PurR family transcriptional regulator